MLQRILRKIDLDERLEVGSSEYSYERLSAAMLFPTDVNRQINYLREQENESGCLCIVHGKERLQRLSNCSVNALQNGVIAGTCLMYFRALVSREDIKIKSGARAEASLRMVSYICKQFNLGREGRAGGKHGKYPTVTTKVAKQVWENYQRVSHLWAAYICMKGVPTNPEMLEHLLCNIDVSVMLLIARQYERWINGNFTEDIQSEKALRYFAPFKVRYHDWCSDDTLNIEIPEPSNIVDFLIDKAKEYIPDN